MNMLKLFKFSYLKDRLRTLGAEITFKNFMLTILGISFVLSIIGYLLYLEPQYIMILVLVFILFYPMILIYKHKADYEKYRFTQVVEYMEQLIYAFNKSGKIRDALIDVYSVTVDTVHDICKEMIDIIDLDDTTVNIYEKAFSVIESRYDCQRMKLLHHYLIEVEASGGKYSHSLNILLIDLRAWASRVLEYQTERRAIQSKVTLSIVFALFSAGLMLNLVPDEYLKQIVVMNGYQIGTLLILILCIVVYYVASSRVCKSYLDNELDRGSYSKYKRQSEYVIKYESKSHKIPRLVKTIITILALGCLIYFKIYYAVPVVAVLGIWMIIGDFLRKASCIKGLTKEITKVFSNWLRSLILYLQTENVQVAIQKSYKSCPEILKPEVYNLILGLDKYPNSPKPYSDFCKGYNVPSIKLAITYLYSISQFGNEDMIAQLDYLVEQSSELSLAEEKIRNEDSLAGFSLLGLMPMLLASLKLALDMTLFLNVVMGMMSNVTGI